MSIYSNDFFAYLREKSRRSATEIVPLICQLIQPNSVVDLGCGTATWLSVFEEHGVENVLGIDGDYVERQNLEVDPEKFHPFDLTQPLVLPNKFDLAISLEVAEHLPLAAADTFINSLTSLSSIILFSAAIPEQGGVEHLNEQWQDYWAEKFARKNYAVIDCIRPQVWQNERVDYWYAQNILLFAEQQYLTEKQPELYKLWQQSSQQQLRLVHPNKYLELAQNYQREHQNAQWYASEIDKYQAAAELKNISFKKVLLAIPRLAKQALVRRAKNIMQKLFSKK